MNQHAKRRYQQGLARETPPPPPVAPPIDRKIVDPVAPGVTAFVVGDEEGAQRLDKYLASVAGLSRTRIKALIEVGQVTLDGAVLDDAGVKVRVGQTVGIDVPPPAAAEPVGEAIPLSIVFEDDHLIVIDKPVGLVVHPSAGHETGTLVNALIAHCGASLSGIGGVMRPGIVHRIDKDTSGLLVVAKSDLAHQGLSALFADHGRTLSLTREYIAFCWGSADRQHGVINTYIGRHPTNREKQAVVRDETRGRHAVTHYKLEKTFGREQNGRSLASQVRCRLETGRTHQIRVHMAHLGHPLLGDATYGAGFKTKATLLPDAVRERVQGLHRQALHAATLGFTHPVTGEEMMFESELPADLLELQDALATLG